MTRWLKLAGGALAASLSLGVGAQGAGALEPGQRLPQAQIERLGKLPAYRVGPREFRVLPQRAAGNGTLVLNQRGVVGTSHHQVIVNGASAQAISGLLAPDGLRPVLTEHFEATGMTILQFSSFDQAVAGFRALHDGLEDAQVMLPVQYGQPRPF